MKALILNGLGPSPFCGKAKCRHFLRKGENADCSTGRCSLRASFILMDQNQEILENLAKLIVAMDRAAELHHLVANFHVDQPDFKAVRSFVSALSDGMLSSGTSHTHFTAGDASLMALVAKGGEERLLKKLIVHLDRFVMELEIRTYVDEHATKLSVALRSLVKVDFATDVELTYEGKIEEEFWHPQIKGSLSKQLAIQRVSENFGTLLIGQMAAGGKFANYPELRRFHGEARSGSGGPLCEQAVRKPACPHCLHFRPVYSPLGRQGRIKRFEYRRLRQQDLRIGCSAERAETNASAGVG